MPEKKGLKLGGRWMNLTWRKAIGDLGHFCTIVANSKGHRNENTVKLKYTLLH